MKIGFEMRLVLVFCLLCVCPFPSYGEPGRGDVALGVNFPGFGARCFLSDRTALELKGQFETNAMVGGLRGYYYFSRKSKCPLFAGLEGDYVKFKGDSSKGTGLAAELFVGGEYFFAKRLSFQLDLGPTLVSLDDKDTSESVNGLEYVANFGINYYFGR